MRTRKYSYLPPGHSCPTYFNLTPKRPSVLFLVSRSIIIISFPHPPRMSIKAQVICEIKQLFIILSVRKHRKPNLSRSTFYSLYFNHKLSPYKTSTHTYNLYFHQSHLTYHSTINIIIFTSIH